MRRLGLTLALTFMAAIPAAAQTAADSAAIRATALDYIQGWYEGNPERMARALHPDLAKRIVRTPQVGASRLDAMGKEQLVEYTRRGGGTRTPAAQRRQDVVILDIFGNAASVRVDAADWIDYLHVGRLDGEWKIVNVLWEMRPRG